MKRRHSTPARFACDFQQCTKVQQSQGYVIQVNMAASKGSDFDKLLEYRIYQVSSYAFIYIPENILVDKPSDQTSRWSSDNDNHPQFLILKLQRPSIVKTIKFGKHEKSHVCNVKKFKIYGGLEPNNMMELLESPLKNDSTPESFELNCNIGSNNHYLPVRYIKILPLQSWGPSINFSIWYVGLLGTDDPKIVRPSIDWLNTYRQREVTRLCMKHFRKFEQQEIVSTLQRVTGVSLEDPYLSNLYDLVVTKGDHLQAENFIANAIKKGYLNGYINAQSYQAIWEKLTIPDPNPGMRGGHQMVIDSTAGVLYLFGGWNGNNDLADLWSYDIVEEKWTLICKDTESVGGPSARSCHKMCLDPVRRHIFTLGRFLDTQYRVPENLKSDFYVYNIDTDKWTQISEDTAAAGGPDLIFDHQMCIDIDRRTIYVLGGRILMPTSTSEEQAILPTTGESIFSDLYSYHVPTGTWQKLACDIFRPIQNIPSIRSRIGHSMLFHPKSRKLYIFAGQRGKEFLNDFFTFDVDANKVEHINFSELGNKDSNHIPAAGFTQRATIDPDLGEIYVLSGLSKDKDKRDDNVQNSFWVYNIKMNSWSCIYRNENTEDKYWAKMQNFEPCPRFAHQLIYDHVKKVHYLFGGNPGRNCSQLRLDDFWRLQLCRPSHEQVLKKCKLIIRKHKFEELAMVNSLDAIQYLQTKISELIDHSDDAQTKEFQLLASVVFRKLQENDSVARNIHMRRTELHDTLSEFFPEAITQPRANLIDLLQL